MIYGHLDLCVSLVIVESRVLVAVVVAESHQSLRVEDVEVVITLLVSLVGVGREKMF